MTVALAISAGAHALLLLAIGGVARFTWPAPPIPIEVRPLHRTVQRIGTTERRGTPVKAMAPAAAAPPAKRPGPGHPKRALARASSTQAPPETRDLSPYAPEDAHLVVLLDSAQLRRSPHRAAVEALLEALPDYRTLLGATRLSPIDDFKALLIATADPRDVTATFLAASYVDSPRLRAAVAGRPLPRGDPRVFRTLAPGLTVLASPKSAAELDAARRDPATKDTRARWLTYLERFAAPAAPGAPALLVTLSDAPALLRLGAELPTPQTIVLAATAEDSPLLHARIAFATEAEATRFLAAWPQVVDRWRRATFFLGLSAALDGLRTMRHGREVEIQGHIAKSEVVLALSWARTFLPAPRTRR